MKKVLKILAATAAVASIIPLRCESDEKGGSLEGLLWKAKWTIDPDYQSDPEVNITFGFNNPFKNTSFYLFRLFYIYNLPNIILFSKKISNN